MAKRYRIQIEELLPFKVTVPRYEGTDGKVYESRYSMPEGIKYKEVQHETGETRSTAVDVYSQEVGELDLKKVIKAINGID